MYRRPAPRPSLPVNKARDLIEQLNHLTIDADLTAPQISETVQAMIQLVQQLPQSLDQLGHALDRQNKLGTIRMDDGTDAAESCAEALDALTDARADLAHAADSLQLAGHPLWHMTVKED